MQEGKKPREYSGRRALAAASSATKSDEGSNTENRVW
jgi:hypothetical protein